MQKCVLSTVLDLLIHAAQCVPYRFSGSAFSEVDFLEVAFSGSAFSEVDFLGLSLSEVSFCEVDFLGVAFSEVAFSAVAGVGSRGGGFIADS